MEGIITYNAEDFKKQNTEEVVVNVCKDAEPMDSGQDMKECVLNVCKNEQT